MNIAGFTLIELMVVIAIVALLAAVAVPAYQSHIKRTNVLKGLNYAYNCLDEVKLHYETNDVYPTEVCGVDSSSGFVASIFDVPLTAISRIEYTTSYSGGTVARFVIELPEEYIGTAAPGTAGDSYITISMRLNSTTGLWEHTCGRWNVGSFPDTEFASFVPNSCHDDNVNLFFGV